MFVSNQFDLFAATQMFLCFCIFYQKLCLQAIVFMQATSGEQSIIDIGLTVKAKKKIIPSILVAHAASGCNTVAPYYAVGKTSVIKK